MSDLWEWMRASHKHVGRNLFSRLKRNSKSTPMIVKKNLVHRHPKAPFGSGSFQKSEISVLILHHPPPAIFYSQTRPTAGCFCTKSAENRNDRILPEGVPVAPGASQQLPLLGVVHPWTNIQSFAWDTTAAGRVDLGFGHMVVFVCDIRWTPPLYLHYPPSLWQHDICEGHSQ